MKPRIAIRNLHHGTLGNPLPFYNYVLGLLQSGAVTHLFFEDVLHGGKAWYAIRKQYRFEELGLDHIKIILSSEELNSECDILLSLDSQARDFSPAVKNFKGLKVYHLMDYFWGEPLSKKVARLQEYGVDFVLSYGSPDRYDGYFKKYAPGYIGRVVPVPFGFSKRFVDTQPFVERMQRCVAVGSVRPLRFSTEAEYKFKEQADFFLTEQWFHKFRRMLVESAESMSSVMDSLLPVYPRYRDYDYDLPSALNRYQMFVCDESLFYFPSAKTFEGPACGTVMLCSTHPSFADLGFKNGINCVMHREFDVADAKKQMEFSLADQHKLRQIAAAGEDFVRSRYSEEMVGKKLAHLLCELRCRALVAGPSLAEHCYKTYRGDSVPEGFVTTPLPTTWYIKIAYNYGGALYCLTIDIGRIPARLASKTSRIVHSVKIWLWRRKSTFINQQPLRDRILRHRFLRNNPQKLLPPASAEEQRLIEELRTKLSELRLIQPNPNLSGPELKWASFVDTLRKRIAKDDPREFLSWDVIAHNMVYDAGAYEMAALRQEPDGAHWLQALKEPVITRRQPFFLFPEANENTIRQAYHLLQFKKHAGRSAESYDVIIDFGGGYGSMCRLVHALGFKGTYIIFDWPVFSLLQEFYLKLTGSLAPKIIFLNDLKKLEKLLADIAGEKLLIATWSLSETSPSLRDEFLRITHPDGMLIAYQKDFGGINNENYFENLMRTKKDTRWSRVPMSYLPSEKNVYLIATHE